ncbi:MAG: DUF2062 domain-containing protein [Methylococcaceae bacterium]
MPKRYIEKLIQKHLPDPEVLINHKNLQFLGDKLRDPNLWHLSRRSVSMAFAVGMVAAWIPVPMQMVISAVGALYYRANLPIAVVLVWITNPVTMPPLFYFAYRVGLWFMDRPSPAENFQFSLDGVMSGLGDTWEPFLLGCFIMGITCSSVTYFGVRYLWARHAFKKWVERKEKRQAPQD